MNLQENIKDDMHKPHKVKIKHYLLRYLNCKKIKGHFGPITFIRNYQNFVRSQHPLNNIFSKIFVKIKESK